MMRARVAPSASRMPISARRIEARDNIRFATFVHATSSTISTAAISSATAARMRPRACGGTRASDSEMAVKTRDLSLMSVHIAGYSACSRAARTFNCACT
jgi:hypothetical protein